MLVLTRKLNEAIVIADEIKVTVLEIKGDRVRIGIEAKKEIEIHRFEVWQKIQMQGEQSCESQSGTNQKSSGTNCTNPEKPLSGNELRPSLSNIVQMRSTKVGG